MTNIEPRFYDLMQEVIKICNTSQSNYLRELVIKDLLLRGVLTHEELSKGMLVTT